MLPAIIKQYRDNYVGEEIVIERKYNNGIWNDTVEYISNVVFNNQTSNQAVIIGNGTSRLEFNMSAIFSHRGGLLGADKLQTYGCNALYRDYTPDFLIVRNNNIVAEIAKSKSKYTKNNVVYTSSIQLINYPGKFYSIPHDPYTDAGTTAAYIAAFDGHKKIFLIGFDNQDTIGYNYNVYAGTVGYNAVNSIISDQQWIIDRAKLATAYNDVDFVWVTNTGRTTMPLAWYKCDNFRQISFRQFVIEANL
jgi:hypothetical protein